MLKFITGADQIPTCGVKEIVVEFKHGCEKEVCHCFPKTSLCDCINTASTPSLNGITVRGFFTCNQVHASVWSWQSLVELYSVLIYKRSL